MWLQSCENCEGVDNPWQEDYDGDSLGDACDPCPLDPTNMSCAAAMSTAFPTAAEYEYWEASSDGLERYLAEQHIYGNGAQGRIGMYVPYQLRNTSEQVPDPVNGDVYTIS